MLIAWQEIAHRVRAGRRREEKHLHGFLLWEMFVQLDACQLPLLETEVKEKKRKN